MVVILATICTLVYGLNLKQRIKYRLLPGPKPRWLLGNAIPVQMPLFFVGRGITSCPQGMPGATRRMFHDWPKRFGDCYRLFLGRIPVVVITDAHLARAVALKHFTNVRHTAAVQHTVHHLTQFHDRPFVLAKLYDGQREAFMRAGTLFARCVMIPAV